MEFFGSDLTNDECEMIALSAIHHAHMADEAEAMQNKWFDYRLWHHVKATYYFAHVYEQNYRRFFAETRDKEDALVVPVFNNKDPLQSRQRTNLHLARQAFDIAGVRYEFGIRFAFSRFCERGWKTMPRTNQLYGDEILADMKAAWVAECRARIQVPMSPFFKAENYVGDVIQNQFHEWLVAQVNMRPLRYMTIGQVVYVDKLMPEDIAVKNFGSDLVNRGKSDAV